MINHNIDPYFLKYVHDINLKPIEKFSSKKIDEKFKGKKLFY